MKTALLFIILFVFSTGLMALIGYGTSAPVLNDTVDPSLTILAPNGGEEWFIGYYQYIIWSATDTNILYNSVNIGYSLNGGADYNTIVENTANDCYCYWTPPAVQSYSAKVRIKVSDNFGNYTQKASANPFSITYLPPRPPDGVAVNTSNGVDAVITWQAVTQTIPPYNLPITPDGYIVLYNESPYEQDEHFYYYLGETTTALSFTHYNVARRRSQMYYKVVAYKDYRGEMAFILAEARQHPDQPFSFYDLKQKLQDSFGGEK